MSGYYGQAEALLDPDEQEGLVGGGLGQLVSLRLTDGEPSDSSARTALRPEQARALAFTLLELAERAERERRR